MMPDQLLTDHGVPSLVNLIKLPNHLPQINKVGARTTHKTNKPPHNSQHHNPLPLQQSLQALLLPQLLEVRIEPRYNKFMN